jgi:uncharacterized Zn finger protein
MAWYGRGYDGGYGGWAPYVPVALKKANAVKYAAQIAKKEKRAVAPVKIEGKKIAKSFWGAAWCDNLESYSDFANRLPRGRTYVRNGSVVDLRIKRGKVQAIVAGSEVYKVTITISTLDQRSWKRIKANCSRSIESLIDLLQGKFDLGVMQRLTEKGDGLFPQPKEIKMDCTCPDWAGVCKHVAAVMYGVGARLDASPEMLFTLRDVDHLELISQAATAENLEQSLTGGSEGSLAGNDLGELFGIELDAGQSVKSSVGRGAPKKAKGVSRKKLPDAVNAIIQSQAKASVETPRKGGRKSPAVVKQVAQGNPPAKKSAPRKSAKRATMPAATRKK